MECEEPGAFSQTTGPEGLMLPLPVGLGPWEKGRGVGKAREQREEEEGGTQSREGNFRMPIRGGLCMSHQPELSTHLSSANCKTCFPVKNCTYTPSYTRNT